MYQYKLNNSYTTYVNWSYYSEARSVCNKIRSQHFPGTACKKSTYQHSMGLFSPLQNGTNVNSKYFGIGTVTDTDSTGIMSVLFGEKLVRFLYPEALKKGQISVAS